MLGLSIISSFILSWKNTFSDLLIKYVVLFPLKYRREIPRHVCIIMDGNRRWARRNHLSSHSEGHVFGFFAMEDILDKLKFLGVKYVSVFAYSLENRKRPKEEKSFLMNLAYEKCGRMKDYIIKGLNFRMKICGRLWELRDTKLRNEFLNVMHASEVRGGQDVTESSFYPEWYFSSSPQTRNLLETTCMNEDSLLLRSKALHPSHLSNAFQCKSDSKFMHYKNHTEDKNNEKETRINEKLMNNFVDMERNRTETKESLHTFSQAKNTSISLDGIEVNSLQRDCYSTLERNESPGIKSELNTHDSFPKIKQDFTQTERIDEDRLRFNLCFGYTGTDDICNGAYQLITKGLHEHILEQDDITPLLFQRSMYTDHCPSPDLLIRTSGEFRLSDFMNWQVGATYIKIMNVMWPDFSIWHLMEAILEYQKYFPFLQSRREALREEMLKAEANHDSSRIERITRYVNRIDQSSYSLTFPNEILEDE